MNDKMYQTVKWLTIGILLGYAGKYALALFRAKKEQNSFTSSSRKETIFSNDDEEEADES